MYGMVWLIGPGPADGTPGEPSGCTEMSHATRGKGEIKQSRPLQLVPHLTNLYILRRMRQVSSMLKGNKYVTNGIAECQKVQGKVLYIGIMVEVLVSAIFKFIVHE